MILIEVTIICICLLLLEWYAKRVSENKRQLNLFFLVCYFGLSVLVVRLLFEYSLYSLPTFLSLLPWTFVVILQLVRHFQELWEARFVSLLLILGLSLAVWLSVQTIQVEVYQTKFVEYLFTGKHIFKTKSIDPNAGRAIKM
jgi:hypothetical protein